MSGKLIRIIEIADNIHALFRRKLFGQLLIDDTVPEEVLKIDARAAVLHVKFRNGTCC